MECKHDWPLTTCRHWWLYGILSSHLWGQYGNGWSAGGAALLLPTGNRDKDGMEYMVSCRGRTEVDSEVYHDWEKAVCWLEGLGVVEEAKIRGFPNEQWALLGWGPNEHAIDLDQVHQEIGVVSSSQKVGRYEKKANRTSAADAATAYQMGENKSERIETQREDYAVTKRWATLSAVALVSEWDPKVPWRFLSKDF